MKISLKATGLPEFVQLTIIRETNLLMHSKLFTPSDYEDIIQELILFYLENFYQRGCPNEAYVVTSLKNYAVFLIKTKAHQRFGLSFSLDDMEVLPSSLIGDGGFSKNYIQLLLADLTKGLSLKECAILNLIKEGYSLDEIAKKYRVSKNTIYKLFEKIKKNYKK